MIRTANKNYCGIYAARPMILGYADDIDIVSLNNRVVRAAFSSLKKDAEFGLVVNEGKKKYLEVTQKDCSHLGICVTVSSHKLENVKKFVYLRTTINTTNK